MSQPLQRILKAGEPLTLAGVPAGFLPLLAADLARADGIEFISDGNGDFARAIGLSMDGSGFGLGTRSQRYSMVVENGAVKSLNVEDAPAKAQISGAENLLKHL